MYASDEERDKEGYKEDGMFCVESLRNMLHKKKSHGKDGIRKRNNFHSHKNAQPHLMKFDTIPSSRCIIRFYVLEHFLADRNGEMAN